MSGARRNGLLFLILGLGALLAAAIATRFRFAGIAAALAFLMLAATSLSQAGQISRSVKPFRHRSARVQAWGSPVPATGDSGVQIDSIMAFGAALLIHLRPSPHGRRTLLKVAQPGPARLEDGRLEIDRARYISWGGKKLTPVPGNPALTIQNIS